MEAPDEHTPWVCPLPVLAAAAGADKLVVAVLGSQWGDEGKGKLVDILAAGADVCCRFNGGANAGHSLVVDGVHLGLHLVPCGVLYDHTRNLLGNGVVIHLPTLLKEFNEVERVKPGSTRRIFISSRAHLVFDFHVAADGIEESDKMDAGVQIGTTKRGIGPCYSSKMARDGLRVGELFDFGQFEQKYCRLRDLYYRRFPSLATTHDATAELEFFRASVTSIVPQIVDSVVFIHDALRAKKKILVEGANATFLDIDFGTYPCVTSSSTTAGGVCIGLGIPPALVRQTIGVVKAYTTRVGEGPFPTELKDATGEFLQKRGAEFGVTTKRPRRCGWFDGPMVRYSSALCNYAAINVTKLDVLTGLKHLRLCTGYKWKSTGQRLHELERPTTLEQYHDLLPIYEELEGWDEPIHTAKSYQELPPQARAYVEAIERITNCPAVWVGVGADRDATIFRGSVCANRSEKARR